MEFEALMDGLKERLRHPLPGPVAHERMRAIPKGPLRPQFQHKTPPKAGSVLILLFPDNGRIKFPLTLRADYGGTHSGQVSLPGGKAEPGETIVETALRECQEEIGVMRQRITVIGRLSDFFVIPSNFMVSPVIGFTKARPVYVADPVEVARIMEGDLGRLISDDAIREREILAARQFPMIAPHFEVEDQIVWGATAMMLNELRTIVLEAIGTR